MQFAAVGLYDSAGAIQTKTIMALGDLPKRFAAPIFGRQLKVSLWFMQGEEEPVIIDFGFSQNWPFAAIVPQGVGEKLGECFLEKLRVNIQRCVAELNVPGDFSALVWKIVLDLRAQILHKMSGLVRDRSEERRVGKEYRTRG